MTHNTHDEDKQSNNKNKQTNKQTNKQKTQHKQKKLLGHKQ
jgi:hypothetical protein